MQTPKSLLSSLVFCSLLVSSFVFYSIQSKAEIYAGAVSASTGGSGRAAVDSGVAPFLNPAMLAHQKGRQIYSGWIQDELLVSFSENSQENALPSSLAFWQKKTPENYKLQDFRLAAAEIVKGVWSIGGSLHYFQIVMPEKTYSQGLLDLGLTVSPVPDLGLAVVFYNLGSKSEDAPQSLLLEKKIGLGFNYVYESFLRSRIDVVSGDNQDFRRSIVMFGLESYMNKWVISRLGYQNNSYQNQDLVSLGIGFDMPKFRLNYAYVFNSSDTKDQRHAVDITIPF